MQSERRRAPRERRTDPRVTAVFAVKNTVENRVQLGQAEDIGPSGMTLRRPKDVPILPNTSVALTFELPGVSEPIAAHGLVVSDTRTGLFRRTGVRFTRVEARAVALIQRFCAERRR